MFRWRWYIRKFKCWGNLTVNTTSNLNTVNISNSLGVDGNFDVNTNKFTIDSGSGNTNIAGTLTVNSDLTLNGSYLTLRANQSQANVLSFEKINTSGTIADGTAYGEINWNGYDGDEYVKGATIFARVHGSAGNNDMPSELVIGLTPDGSNTTTEYVNIMSNGLMIINGVLNATSTESSTSSLTGSFVCSGGVGISENLNVGGNFKVNTDRFTIDSGSGNTSIAGTLNVNSDLTLHGSYLTLRANQSQANVLSFEKINTVGTIADGTAYGEINWYGHDGDEYVKGATIFSRVDGSAGDNDMPSELVIGLTPDGSNTTTEYVNIKNDGEVNISGVLKATSSTSSTNSSTGSFICSGGVGIAENLNVDGYIIPSHINGTIERTNTFGTTNSDRACFLVLQRDGSTGRFYMGSGGSSPHFIMENQSSSGNIYLDTDSGRIMTLEDGGNVGVGLTPSEKLDVNGVVQCTSLTETSDDRIKYNESIISNSDALNIINQLVPKYYEKILEKPYGLSGTWIPTDEEWETEKDLIINNNNKWKWGYEIGLIAQDVKNISELQHCVTGEETRMEDVITDNGDGDTTITQVETQTPLKINYNNIFTYNIAATKELTTLLNIEKAKVTELETKVSNLETQLELIKNHLNLG